MNTLRNKILELDCALIGPFRAGFNECKQLAADLAKVAEDTEYRNQYQQSLDLYAEYEDHISSMAGKMLKPSFSDWLKEKLKVDPNPGNCGSGWMEDVNGSEKEKIRYVARVLRSVSDLKPGGVLTGRHWGEAISAGSLLMQMIGEGTDEAAPAGAIEQATSPS